MGEFYKYIIKRDGKYVVIKDGLTFGTYDDITNALHDRDLLIEFDWDMGEVLSQDEKYNKYKEMELPAWDRYITKQKMRDKTYYVVQKTIDGEQKRFGYFKTYNEAVERRDEMEAKGWVKETN